MSKKKKKTPAEFRRAAKQLAALAPQKDDRVVDQSGSNGSVIDTAAGVVKVKHDDGKIAYHPLGAVRKVNPPPAEPVVKNKPK